MKLRIGKLKLSNPLILAPMHGVNCTAFRLLCRQQGAALVTTPMMHALMISSLEKRQEIIASFIKKERPLSIQIIGAEPKQVGKAVEIIEPYADIIDLNFGCPDNNIVKQKMGAYFSKHPNETKKIISAAVGATNKPVTVKIRSGWHDKNLNYLKTAKIAEDSGASAITLHARTKEQRYSGKSDWNKIKELKQKTNIPVIGNGDIWSAEDAKRMLEEIGCDFAMIGRGAIGNPHIFKQSSELIEHNKIIPDLTDEEKTEQLKEFIKLYLKYQIKPSFIEIKKQAMWFCNGMTNATDKRRKIAGVKTQEKLASLIEEGI